MNRRYIIPILAAALLLLPGCTKDPVRGNGGIPMHVAPTLAGHTKGSLTTDDLTDFYLQVVSDDTDYCYFDHVSKGGDGAWTTSSPLYWKDEKASVSYNAARFGRHAFTAEEFAKEGGVTLSVPADQSTQERLNAADLLTVSGATAKYENTSDGILPVTLAHGLAKVTFTLTLGPSFYDNLFLYCAHAVTDFTVKGTRAGFTFLPQKGTVSALDGPQTAISPMEVSFTLGTPEAKTTTVVYEAILVPQRLAPGNLMVSYCVDKYTFEWFNAAEIVLEAGKNYRLALNATAAPSRPKVGGHEFVMMGGGLKWASMNVGAENPWDYGDFFAWGEVETKTEYTLGTYKFYNSTSRSFSRYNWEDYDSLLKEDDAAWKKWGDSWRIPTEAEWSVLIDKSNFTWEWQTDYQGSGINGMLVTSKMAGYEGNSIFLPAAGYIEENKNGFEKDWGMYWSSTHGQYEISRAWSPGFGKTTPDSRYELRYRGLPVRAVSE